MLRLFKFTATKKYYAYMHARVCLYLYTLYIPMCIYTFDFISMRNLLFVYISSFPVIESKRCRKFFLLLFCLYQLYRFCVRVRVNYQVTNQKYSSSQWNKLTQWFQCVLLSHKELRRLKPRPVFLCTLCTYLMNTLPITFFCIYVVL